MKKLTHDTSTIDQETPTHPPTNNKCPYKLAKN